MMKKIIKGFQIFSFILMIIIIGLCLYFIIDTLTHKDRPSKMFGFYLFELSGDSMRPDYKKGDLVFVKPPKDGVYAVDMVVTYKSEDGLVITHQIVKIEDDQITCQGLSKNNTTPDEPITQDMIYGQVVGSWKGFGPFKKFISSQWGVITIVLYAILIFEGMPFIYKKLFGKE
jgi:signal peptidase